VTTVCIVGAGAVGSVLGTRLAASGVPTSALARGDTLAALRRHGWRLRTGDGATRPPTDPHIGTLTAPVAAAEDDAAALGPHDVVLVALKAPALTPLAPALAPLLGGRTVVVPAMNGVPWWFFDGIGGPHDGLRLDAADPGGVISAALPASRVVGCVVHLSASVAEPGLAVHRLGDELVVGEPAGGPGERAAAVADLLRGAGLRVTESPRIQRDVWFKLWGNLTMNPISALTGATTDRILDDELVRAFADEVMLEAAAIGARIGCPVDARPADRHAVTRKLGAMRTSMLADAEAGRPLELDALVTAVREIGAAVGVPTPHTDTLLGLTRLSARVRGTYPAAEPVTPA
jgi:2-dehydropantoate 2-reductase